MSHQDAVAIFAFSMFAIAYAAYWFFMESAAASAAFGRRFGKAGSVVHVTSARMGFSVAAGIFPALVLPRIADHPLADFGISFTIGGTVALICAAAFAACFSVSFFQKKRPVELEFYPQIRAKSWNAATWAAEIAGWAAYLAAYEFAFRGYLLATARGAGMSTWPAVAALTALYVALHIPKGLKEAALAAPFGIVLSWASLVTGTIWIALFAHIGLALGNDAGALRQAGGVRPDSNRAAGGKTRRKG